VGNAFVALVDATIPQSKETYQYLKFGQAPFALVSSTSPIPQSQRYYLSFRDSRGAFNVTQAQNKTGSDFSSEVAPELSELLQQLHSNFKHGEYVFGNGGDAPRD
jgi:hypothetical protein